jgi:hypothetical protein
MNIRHGTITLCFALFISAHVSKARAQSRQQYGTGSIPAAQFELLTEPHAFVLQFTSNGKTKRVAIPRDWLIPPQEEKDEESTYVSSFQYDKEVSAFPIGNGKAGLHLSSYAIQEQGSAQAAAGRDLFLIFDPTSLHLSRGGIERGITKERVRSEGCFEASAERYFVADIDGDGLTDIGVSKEELECVPTRYQQQDLELIEGPVYKQVPVAWYVFRSGAWKLEPALSGKFPERYQELPLIGIDKTPVDFVGRVLWETCDRTKWPKTKKARKNGGN